MRALMTLLGLVITVSLAAQDKPLTQAELAKKPPYERLLKGDDAKKAAELDQKLAAAGSQDEAIKLQEEVVALRTRVQGADHWEVINEQVALKTLRSLDAEGLRQQTIAIQANEAGFQRNAQGRYAEAQPLYQKALAIRRKVLGEDHPDTASSYNNEAGNLAAQGKAAEAQPLLQKALEIRRKVLGEDHPDTAQSYNNVAVNLNAQGKAAEAQPYYRKAMKINRRVLGEEHPDTAQIYNNVAVNLQAQGKAAEAVPFLRQAIFSHEASRLNRAKGIERAIGEEFNPRLLLAAIEQARSPVDAWTQVELSLARGLLDQQGQAKSLLTPEEAAELGNLRGRVTDLQSQILVLVSRAKRTADETTRLDGLIRDRQQVGQKLAKLAVAESERAVARREQIQAAIPTASALLLWVDVKDNSGQVQEHFACVVRREGEPKWHRLPGTGDKGKWTKEDSQLPDQLREELSRRSPSQATIAALAKKLQAQRIAPLLQHLDGVKTLYIVGVNQMAGIPVEVLAPEFAISYVPSGTFLARLPKKPKFENTLLAVGDPIYEVKKAKRVELTVLPSHGLLVQGLAPGGAAEKLGLQPGDVLLNYGDSKIEKLDQLRPAIQKAAESGDKTVSVAVWRVVEDNKAVEKTLQFPVGPLGVILAQEPAPIAIADRRKTEVLFAKLRGGELWADLPGTRFEVSQIAKLFPSAKVLLDGQASERNIDALRQADELKQFRYLHFATHGKANNTTAFESKLILSQDQKKEEFSKPGEPYFNNEISACEVLEFWNLNADLVTLSACETGLGKSGSGDGLLGFAQAFLLKGARSVCLSLWEVDDTATALLMQRFYQNLLGKRPGLSAPMSKQLALKEAKEWLRDLTNAQATELTASLMNGVSRGTRGEIKVPKRIKADAPPESKPYANPHYWSAFILIGDPE